ncbi:hypothetical protein EYF80_026567 [Liparis tanakae]|uniref:Uncharacterized protein n=1 Tax=Liparis tanakae TaxID=230148 RepID=A0A4Z2HE97_9TELE|nr:hypothetical protein EYF80_026567 [Liparis tanakae]
MEAALGSAPKREQTPYLGELPSALFQSNPGCGYGNEDAPAASLGAFRGRAGVGGTSVSAEGPPARTEALMKRRMSQRRSHERAGENEAQSHSRNVACNAAAAADVAAKGI